MKLAGEDNQESVKAIRSFAHSIFKVRCPEVLRQTSTLMVMS